MPNLRDLRKRIRAVDNIKRITSAMEKIAAARLFRTRGLLTDARPYSKALEEVARDLLNSQPEATHPLVERNKSGYPLVVLVTSDRGFCGAYNSRVVQEVAEFAGKLGSPGARYIVFGRKGLHYLERNNLPIVASYTRLPVWVGYDAASDVADKIMGLYLSGEISAAFLASTEFLSVGRHDARVTPLLPVELKPEPDKNYMNYSYEPEPAGIIGAILPRLVKTRIWIGLLESVVSEYAERMTMMERATKNTDDLIAALTLAMNKARQTMITRELTDIVGAAETIA